jgi:uncharacterized protein YbgA (DUF1722 family)/uncharacterized protein YbbK (DUF523 family)
MTPAPPTQTDRRIRIGVSACLLGDEVRYDGGHKRDAFLTTVLGPHVEWVKVCPEVETGMGTPREAIRLVAEEGTVRLLTVKTGVDHTGPMTAYAAKKAIALEDEDLSGYVLKADSPSCGMTQVKVYSGKGQPLRCGVGIFAQALLARFPHLPIEEEGRLADPQLRDNFIERVFAYRRLRDLFEARWTTGDLVRFHTAHKLVLLAHSTEAYTRLGHLVSGASSADRASLRLRYSADLMAALSAIATPQRHTNVLQHAAGYFKNVLDAASRAELLAAIEHYRLGRVPLDVPIALLRDHARIHDVQDLADQWYLAPHPTELLLRNHS